MRARSTIVIEDVEADREYTRFRAAARKARYRGVQTTPLRTKRGRILGAVSTLFVNPHRPTKIELSTLDRYSQIAADHLNDLLGERDLKDEARRLHKVLYDEARRISVPLGAPSNRKLTVEARKRDRDQSLS
jgi:hypothetical protein